MIHKSFNIQPNSIFLNENFNKYEQNNICITKDALLREEMKRAKTMTLCGEKIGYVWQLMRYNIKFFYFDP